VDVINASFEVVSSGKPIGAEVRGLDLNEDLDDEEFRGLQEAINKHAVLYFRKQSLSIERHRELAMRLGPLHTPLQEHGCVPGYRDVHLVSNIVENGKLIGLSDAGRNWHSDAAYMANPAMYVMLFAMEIPRRPGQSLGNTVFGSTAAAYTALSEDMKRKLEGKRAIHDVNRRFEKNKARGVLTRPELSEEEKLRARAVSHPVFRTHHLTGRKCIYVNPAHTERIDGMSDEESRATLDFLFQHCAEDRFIFEHRWQVGDVLLWDNIPTMHRVNFDYGPDERRLLRRVSTDGPIPK